MSKQEWLRVWSLYRANGGYMSRWVDCATWGVVSRVAEQKKSVDWLAMRAKWMNEAGRQESPGAVIRLTTAC